MKPSPARIKEVTRAAYDQYPERFGEFFQRSFLDNGVARFVEGFAAQFPQNAVVADLGSGPGYHARAIAALSQVANVVCLDLSMAMLQQCQGLLAVNGDLEFLPLRSQSFDGVWAFTSLLHLPRRAVRPALAEVGRILKPGGVFALAVKEGSGGGFEDRRDFPGAVRWFTYFSEQGFRRYFGRQSWELLDFERTLATAPHPFLNYLFRKR